MAFSAADVKNLREMTGVGMMDCKKALTAADGDISLGFLTAGEADDSTEIFVYQTNSVKFDYNVGGKIGIARCEQHVAVSLFLAIGLVHLNEICLGMSHRSV